MRRLACFALACGLVAAFGWQHFPRHDDALYKACDHLSYDAPSSASVKAWGAYAAKIEDWSRLADPRAQAILNSVSTDAARYGTFPQAIHTPGAVKRQEVKNALYRDQSNLFEICRSDGWQFHL
jgi:hypothetical protein